MLKCESGGMVYTADLKSAAHGLAGSNPASRTRFVSLAQWIEHRSSTPLVGSSNLSRDAKIYALVAQWLEQWTHNPLVGGSSPFERTMHRWQSGPMQRIANP